MARIGTIAANSFARAQRMARAVADDLKGLPHEIASNDKFRRVFGDVADNVAQAWQKQGGKIAGEQLKKSIEKLGEDKGLLKYFQNAIDYFKKGGTDAIELLGRTYGPGDIDTLEYLADVLKDNISQATAAANAAAAQRVKAIRSSLGAGAKAWFSPKMVDPVTRHRDWGAWGIRMGITAGGLMGLGTLGRAITGGGGMFHNREGEFDIAGIPFV